MIHNITPDELKVRATLVAMAAAVDRRAWDMVGRCLADEIVLDYTTLFGGARETLAGREVVSRWQGMLPGFDATRHIIGEPSVTVSRDYATGEATIDAIHLLDRQSWKVIGDYRFAMQREDDLFRITSLTFLLSEEFGERGLTDEAARRVAQPAGDDATAAEA